MQFLKVFKISKSQSINTRLSFWNGAITCWHVSILSNSIYFFFLFFFFFLFHFFLPSSQKLPHLSLTQLSFSLSWYLLSLSFSLSPPQPVVVPIALTSSNSKCQLAKKRTTERPPRCQSTQLTRRHPWESRIKAATFIVKYLPALATYMGILGTIG